MLKCALLNSITNIPSLLFCVINKLIKSRCIAIQLKVKVLWLLDLATGRQVNLKKTACFWRAKRCSTKYIQARKLSRIIWRTLSRRIRPWDLLEIRLLLPYLNTNMTNISKVWVHKVNRRSLCFKVILVWLKHAATSKAVQVDSL
jgi:hypothetical protein